MDPRTKQTKTKTVNSKGKGRKPIGRRSNLSAPTAKTARTPPRRIDIQVEHVLTGPPSIHPSDSEHPPHPPQQYAHPGYLPHPPQRHKPPAYSRHLPPSYATREEIHSGAYADDYPGAYPDFHRLGGIYPPPPPPPSVSAIDYLRGTMPPPEFPSQTAAYNAVVGMLSPLGQYPGIQPPSYQSFLQPPILQLPVYSIGHIFPPQYSPSFQSLYQPQPTADQQLLPYTEFPLAVDSSYPGLFELPMKQNNESEATAGSALPSNTMSMAETTRKFDEILGKRADQRTEEENRFREEHLIARQIEHTRDAADLKRRRLSDRKRKKKTSSHTEESP
jgi:hypothetical protein